MTVSVSTPDRGQSKTLIPSTNADQKSFNRYRVFDSHLSPDWRQMAIENYVSSYYDPRSSIVKMVFGCRLSGMVLVSLYCVNVISVRRPALSIIVKDSSDKALLSHTCGIFVQLSRAMGCSPFIRN